MLQLKAELHSYQVKYAQQIKRNYKNQCENMSTYGQHIEGFR